MLRHYRMTPSQFATLPEGDQVWLLGYEIHRARELKQWRERLVGNGGKDSKLTPEAATLLMLGGL